MNNLPGRDHCYYCKKAIVGSRFDTGVMVCQEHAPKSLFGYGIPKPSSPPPNAVD